MKIFVFAYDRFDTMTTSSLLRAEGIEHVVLCHSEADKARFIKSGTAKAGNIIATGNGRGLAKQRNFALGLVNDGEWCLFLNDDLLRVTMLNEGIYYNAQRLIITEQNRRNARLNFNNEISLRKFVSICEDITKQCDAERIHLAGFTSSDNTLFREYKVRRYGLVDGRAWLVKKRDGVTFDENCGVKEDHEWTARNIVIDGKVYINNWVCPYFSRNTKGGYGRIEERYEEMKHDCAYIIKKYPYLFKYKSKKGYPGYTHITFTKL